MRSFSGRAAQRRRGLRVWSAQAVEPVLPATRSHWTEATGGEADHNVKSASPLIVSRLSRVHEDPRGGHRRDHSSESHPRNILRWRVAEPARGLSRHSIATHRVSINHPEHNQRGADRSSSNKQRHKSANSRVRQDPRTSRTPDRTGLAGAGRFCCLWITPSETVARQRLST